MFIEPDQPRSLPVTFRRSRFCDAGTCVEVGFASDSAFIRDSKQSWMSGAQPVIELSRSQFDHFLSVSVGESNADAQSNPVSVDITGDRVVLSSQSVSLEFDADEWSAFVAGARVGDFFTPAPS